jgi:hypothetical protein
MRSPLNGALFLVLVLVCGSARATSFTGPASLTLGPLSPDPGCQSILGFGSTLAFADTADGFRAAGDVTISSSGNPIGNCLIYIFFGRTISEPNGTLLTSETSISGTLDAVGPFQLTTTHMDYLTYIPGSGCFATATVPTPSSGTGIPFSVGPVMGGPCAVTSPAIPVLQGVVTMFVNDQPGTLTLHFDSLRSEAHVQAIPEPGNGFTVFLVVVASAIARQMRRSVS